MTFSHKLKPLHELSKDIALLRGVSSHLDWDQETYMPPGADGNRAQQLKLIAGLLHEKQTSMQFEKELCQHIDLKTAAVKEGFEPHEIAALKEWREDYLRHKALPRAFIEELSELQSKSVSTWHMAKKENAFTKFAPFLEKLIKMNQQKADYLGYEKHPYDALLHEYEPGIDSSYLSELFTNLKKNLKEIIDSSAPFINEQTEEENFCLDKQVQFSKLLLNYMGYDFKYGRLDISAHPFSSATHPTDSRITTRLDPKSIISNISAVLHEGGHALYEMGLPAKFFGSPLCEARSYGVHESQSRWWETLIGLSLPFWQFFYPKLQSLFYEQLKDVTLSQFYQKINRVQPSLIRVEADEVTYPLHIIIRFEIEKGLIDGSIKIRDLPEIWNEKMKSNLNITPKDNAEGCMQDIHWAMGAFGYFPSYALGNIYAAHIFQGFSQDHSNWQELVGSGNLSFIKNWLQENIYQHGRRYSTLELLKKAGKQSLSIDPYITHLKNKVNTQIG